MKSKAIIGWSVLLGALWVVWIVSWCLAPLSVENGVFVSLAKYMAQGLTPYADFQLGETPLGIALLSGVYKVLGTETSGYAGLAFIALVHGLNFFLLGKLMKRVSLKPMALLVGLFFYFFLVYSSDGVMMNLEPMAVSFILGCCLLILKRTRLGLWLGAACMVLAVACKWQSIVLLPVMLVLVFWQGKRNEFKPEKGLLFLAITVVGILIGGMGIAVLTQQPDWYMQLVPPQEEVIFPQEVWYERLTYLVIQGGRCSLFFWLLIPFFWKKLSVHGKRFAGLSVLAFVCYLPLLLVEIKVPNGMLVYPFVAVAFAQLFQAIPNRKVAAVLAVLVCILPAGLSGREFLKLEGGKLKAQQQEELATLKQVIEKPGKAVVLFDDCYEYDLGPQIFSELSHIRPVYLKTSRLGLESQPNEQDSLIGQIQEADYLIMNEEGFSVLSYSASSELFFEVISACKSYGTGSYLIYAK